MASPTAGKVSLEEANDGVVASPPVEIHSVSASPSRFDSEVTVPYLEPVSRSSTVQGASSSVMPAASPKDKLLISSAKEDGVLVSTSDGVDPPLLALAPPQGASGSLDPSGSIPPAGTKVSTGVTTTKQQSYAEIVQPQIVAGQSTGHLNSKGPPFHGAWTKPLFSSARDTTNELVLKETDAPANVFLTTTDWPTLRENSNEKEQNYIPRHRVRNEPQKNTTPKFTEDVHKFPWAAKMNPETRNLQKTTSPVYLEDGTPKIQVPNHVLLYGLENQKEYIIGQFYRCSTPSGGLGLINAVANKIWGRKCRIFSKQLDKYSYLFHIPDVSTRQWVLQRGVWHIDDCMLFVGPWRDSDTLELPKINTIPIWVTLKNVPVKLYSLLGISWIASGLGAPMATNKPRLDPTLMGEAKILVEVELGKPFPKRIFVEDKQGKSFIVDVEYAWIPMTCKRCGELGHKDTRCLTSDKITTGTTANTETTITDPISSKELPIIMDTDPKWVPITKKKTTPKATSNKSSAGVYGTILGQPSATTPISDMVNDDNITRVPSSSMATAPTSNNSSTTTFDETTEKEEENQTIATNAATEISPNGKSTTSPIQDTQVENVQMDSVLVTIVEDPEDDSFTEDLPSDNFDEDKAIEDIIQPKSSRGRNVKPSLKAKEMQKTPAKGRRGKGRVRGRNHR